MLHHQEQTPPGGVRSIRGNARVSTDGRSIELVGKAAQGEGAGQLTAVMTSRLLRSLEQADRVSLLEGCRIVSFRRGEVAVRPHDDVVAVVLSGALIVSIAAVDGCERVTDLLGPGATWGVAQALASHRNAKLKALTTSDVLFVRGDRLRACVDERSAIARAALEVVAAETRTLRDESERLEGTSTSQRVVLRLLELVERWGAAENDGTVRITLPLTQEILAAWVHSSREATAKALHGLRDAGIVTTRPRELTVLDLEGLRSRAGQPRGSGSLLTLLGS
jgi:CRP/FNR family transcriptional regulator, cyclic AMP receptor protein